MIYFVFIYSVLKIYLILDIYQQSHYNIKDYFKHFSYNVLFYDACIVLATLVGLYSDNVLLIYFSGIYILLYSVFYFSLKVKLVFSKRITRLIIITIVYEILLIFVPYVGSFSLIFIEFSMIPLLYLEILISKMFNRKYIKSAKEKIDSFKGTKVIITGSYGKTSTKMLMNQLLNVYCDSIQTPKSYNTPLGISKFINDEIIDIYDYLVLEFGASKKNDISELLKITKPDVAVVTEIGFMHMNGFKTIENVIEEKMLLAKSANIAILNYDNEYIRNYPLDNKCILSYGLANGDYKAKNIKDGCFDFYYKEKFIMNFETSLIGNHQILNLLACLSYAHHMEFDLNKLSKAIKLFKVEANRLELKKYGNRLVLDDSFNSNLKGFVEALRILGAFKCKRILITPGIVELGRYKKSIYQELITHIVKNIDIVILVGYRECRELYYLLRDYNLDIYLVRNFIEGYSLYSTIIKKLNKSALLIENDLPDIYKRGLGF